MMTLGRRSFFKGLGVAATAGLGIAGKAAAVGRKEPAADAMGMLYDSTRCIGCQACVVACRQANGLPPEIDSFGMYDASIDLSGSTMNIIKLCQDGGSSAFMKMQCMHCVDPACVSACMFGALHKAEHGIVAYDPGRCIGCRYCQVACPFLVPKFEWDSAAPKIVKCELCRHREQGPACCEVCPRAAVVYGKRGDLLAEAHRRIAENPGVYHPKVYGETDGGGTQVLYLSAVPFEKLGLPKLGDEPVPQLSESVQHSIYQGFVLPGALYALLAFVMWRNRKAEARSEEEKP
jgi:Fe-S-cluster-containing dehydrogenase component